MSNDLVLRARLVQQGYSDEDIVKFLGMSKLPGGGLASKIPVVGGAIHRGRTGMSKDEYNTQVEAEKARKQQIARNKTTRAIQAKGGINTLSSEAPAMGGTANIGAGDQTFTEIGQQQLEQNTKLPDVSNLPGNPNPTPPAPAPAAPEPAAPAAPAPAAPAPEEPATGGTEEAAPATETAPATTPATTPATGGTSTAATPTAGGGAVNPNVQNMAQQFQAGQDMQTIQQGKGADKKTYMNTRSGLGMLADAATFGLTSRFGSTGSAARRKANEQSEQQTKDYQAARGRMNQRAMGMAPVMTSLDSQLSAYADILSIRKGVQERNTTTNLRRR